MVNSDKGLGIIKELDCHKWLVDFPKVMQYNSAFFLSPEMHPNRSIFFEQLNICSENVEKLIDKYVYINLYQRIKDYVKSYIRKRKTAKFIRGGDLVKVSFRNKKNGWLKYELSFVFELNNK